MARIPYFDTAQATGRAAELIAKLPPLNIFRMLGHGDQLIDGFVRLGNHLLSRTAVDPVLREIAIIRVGVLSEAAYEIQQHETIARRMGMSEELLAAIHAGPGADGLDERQHAVLAFTDDVVANVRASDATFAPIQALFSVQELEELLVTIGYYMMVSRFLATLDVDLETEPDAVTPRLPGTR
jgi:4-carboxymuconolactone decarboxylase